MGECRYTVWGNAGIQYGGMQVHSMGECRYTVWGNAGIQYGGMQVYSISLFLTSSVG